MGNKVHHFKDNKLHIYIRTDKYNGKIKSDNWVGRTFIQGKQKIVSSKTKNFKKAKDYLFKWYDDLQFQKKHNIQIHTSSVKDLYQQFLTSKDKSTDIEGLTKKWYKDRWNMIEKCKEFMNLKVETMEAVDVKDTYIKWRFNRAKAQSKVLRGKTLSGDLVAIQGFITWCVEKKIRKDKIINIKKILSRKLRSQRTLRIGLSKEQYTHLQAVSRKRYQNGRTLRIRFERERLHQFIIFMVGTGLRVDECLNLHFEDVELVDRQKSKRIIEQEIRLVDDKRYYLKIYLRKSKTNKEREVKSVSSAYFAYKRLINLYKTTGLGKLSGNIWNVNTFRHGLNSLLEEANLKTIKKGDRTLTIDSKSFRNTFIQFMLDKGVTSQAIAKNCGTSTTMIDKFYTANTALETALDSWLTTGRDKIKAVS